MCINQTCVALTPLPSSIPGIRTHDLSTVSHLRYQLDHSFRCCYVVEQNTTSLEVDTVVAVVVKLAVDVASTDVAAVVIAVVLAVIDAVYVK